MDLSAPALRLHGKGMLPNAFIPWHVVSSVCAPQETLCSHTLSPKRRLAAAQRGWEGISEEAILQVHDSIWRGVPQED